MSFKIYLGSILSRELLLFVFYEEVFSLSTKLIMIFKLKQVSQYSKSCQEGHQHGQLRNCRKFAFNNKKNPEALTSFRNDVDVVLNTIIRTALFISKNYSITCTSILTVRSIVKAAKHKQLTKTCISAMIFHLNETLQIIHI